MNPILPASTLLTASSLAQTQTGAIETTKTHLGSPEKAKKNLEKLIQKNGDKNMYEADYEYAVFLVSISKEEALAKGLVPDDLKESLPDSENLTFGISFLNHSANLKDDDKNIPQLEAQESDTNHHYGEVVVNLILPRDKTYYITQNLLVDEDKALEKGNKLGISKTKVDEISIDINKRGFKREVKVAVKNNNNEEIGFTHESFGMPMVMKKEQKFSGSKDVSYESRYQKAKIGFGGTDNLKTENSNVKEVASLQALLKNGTVKVVLTGRAESVWEVLDAAASQDVEN